MQKYVISLILILCTSVIEIQAEPFLVCDPQEGVDYYNIYQDDVLIYSNQPAEVDGSVRYDLKDVTPGAYNWKVEACNDWGCKMSVNPYLSDTAIQSPENLRLSK